MFELVGLLSFALPVTALIVFFVMARDVRDIRNSLRRVVERERPRAPAETSGWPPSDRES